MAAGFEGATPLVSNTWRGGLSTHDLIKKLARSWTQIFPMQVVANPRETPSQATLAGTTERLTDPEVSEVSARSLSEERPIASARLTPVPGPVVRPR